jgi:hypothetical protein
LNASACRRRVSWGLVTRWPSMMCICRLSAHLRTGHGSSDPAHQVPA